jgi:hypothetical protein
MHAVLVPAVGHAGGLERDPPVVPVEVVRRYSRKTYRDTGLTPFRLDSGIAGALNATTPLWTLVLAFTVRSPRASVSCGSPAWSWVSRKPSDLHTIATLLVDPASAPTWSLGSWLALAVLGIIGTGLAYVINYSLIRTEGPVGAAVVLGFLAIDETAPALFRFSGLQRSSLARTSLGDTNRNK